MIRIFSDNLGEFQKEFNEINENRYFIVEKSNIKSNEKPKFSVISYKTYRKNHPTLPRVGSWWFEDNHIHAKIVKEFPTRDEAKKVADELNK